MDLRQFLSMCQSNTIMLQVIDIDKNETVYAGGFTHFAISVKEGKFYDACVVFFAIEDNTLIIKIR